MKLVYMIINYNDASSVLDLWNQIKDYTSIDEVLVVDNHSSDDSFSVLKKIKQKKLRVIQTESNRGYGSAINYGTNDVLKRYSDAYIVISNADIVVSSEKDLITLTKGLEKKNVGITAPNIIEHGIYNRGWKLPTPGQDILENLVYFVTSNLIGTSNPYLYSIGNSMITDPLGKIIANAQNTENAIFENLNMTLVRKLKKEYPIYNLD